MAGRRDLVNIYLAIYEFLLQLSRKCMRQVSKLTNLKGQVGQHGRGERAGGVWEARCLPSRHHCAMLRGPLYLSIPKGGLP